MLHTYNWLYYLESVITGLHKHIILTLMCVGHTQCSVDETLAYSIKLIVTVILMQCHSYVHSWHGWSLF